MQFFCKNRKKIQFDLTEPLYRCIFEQYGRQTRHFSKQEPYGRVRNGAKPPPIEP